MSAKADELIRIAIVGDYQPENVTHTATDAAIQHSAAHLGVSAGAEWVPTETVGDPATTLADFQAVWIAPGSPYRSLDGALEAIRYARLSGVPLLGTCGGFQHIALEFARNVLGLSDADHAESNPSAACLFITPLSCSLAGKAMTLRIEPQSIAGLCYRAPQATENYYCNFGLNPQYESELERPGMRITGRDLEGEARILELRGHPFFVGTLFVPQTRSAPDSTHPLIDGFLKVALR